MDFEPGSSYRRVMVKGNHEPNPLWPAAPRLCPQRALPPYRYVPGLNPHPEIDPKGHSYGKRPAAPAYLPPERWRENETYLFGIDLYHQGFFWEAHEAWETLWHLTDKEGPEGQFLQGLIQNSAAQLKQHLGQDPAAQHLRDEAVRRLQIVLDSGRCDAAGRFMGVLVFNLMQQISNQAQPRLEVF